MSCVVVPEINEACEDNIGGVATVSIIAEDDLTLPLPAVSASPDDWTIATDMTLVDALVAGFEDWNFTEETAILDEAPNDAGNYDVSLKLSFSKDTALKRNTFRKMHSKCCKYYIVLTDENGHQKLLTKMKFRDTYTTGQANSDSNQYDCEFYKSGTKAYTYTGTIPRKT